MACALVNPIVTQHDDECGTRKGGNFMHRLPKSRGLELDLAWLASGAK